jgi:hypothetical protein
LIFLSLNFNESKDSSDVVILLDWIEGKLIVWWALVSEFLRFELITSPFELI